MAYLFRTEVEIESKAKFLGLIGTGKFILNEPFTIRFRFQNVSENGEIFPGGLMHILIDWHGGAPEWIRIQLGKLEALQATDFFSPPNDLTVHNVGMGTICFKYAKGDSKDIHLLIGDRKVLPASETDSVICGIPATSWSEIYTLCALIINTAVLVLSLLRDFGLFHWFSRLVDP